MQYSKILSFNVIAAVVQLLSTGCCDNAVTSCEAMECQFTTDWNQYGPYEYVSSYDVIQLESTDDSRIASVDKVLFECGTYYVLDTKLRRVLMFDETGRYITKIDRVGRGPNEYLDIYDMCIRGNEIYLLTWDGIQVCGLSGEYERTILTDCMADKFFVMDNGHVLMANILDSDDFAVHEYDIEGNLCNGYLKIEKAIREVLDRYGSYWNFYECDGAIYLSVPLYDTIYQIGNGQTIQVFSFHTENNSRMLLEREASGMYGKKNFDSRFVNFFDKLESEFFTADDKRVSSRYFSCCGSYHGKSCLFLYDRIKESGEGGICSMGLLTQMMFSSYCFNLTESTCAVDLSGFCGGYLDKINAVVQINGNPFEKDVFSKLKKMNPSEDSNPCLLVFSLK